MTERTIQSQLALCPYSCPTQRDIPPAPKRVDDTFRTLFTFDPSREDSRKLRDKLFHELDKNMGKIYNLQDRTTNYKEKQFIHGDSLSHFLHLLCDPTLSLVSLSPVPSMSNLDSFTDLFLQLFSMKVPPDRAGWALHHYVYQTKARAPQITENVMSIGRNIQRKNQEYFVKLVYSLYTKSMLECIKIIEWLVDEFPPLFLEVFKNEIFTSYHLLFHCLSSPTMIGYFEMMEVCLRSRMSQLVQISISTSFAYPDLNERFRSVLAHYMTDQSKKRANSILKIIKNDYISFYTNVFILMCNHYPFYEIPNLLNEFSILIQFCTDAEKKTNVIELFSLIRDFPDEHESVASVVIEFIEHMNVPFPLYEFICFLYENEDHLYDFSIFFYLLQCRGFFCYLDFIGIIKRKGLSITKKKITLSILLMLPPKEYTNSIKGKVRQILLVNDPSMKEEKVFNNCLENIDDNFEGALVLHPYYLYQLGDLILKNKTNSFRKKSSLLAQLGILFLIIPLFKEDPKPVFSVVSVLLTKKLISLLYLFECLDKFAGIITKDSARYFVICQHINGHYSKNSKYFTKYLADVKKICEKNKDVRVYPNRVRKLFLRYSHLCNIHLLNFFFNVNTANDLQQCLHHFLNNLLSFRLLNVSILWEFFVGFSESLCVTNSCHFFIKELLSVLLFEFELLLDEDDQTVIRLEILSHFFLRIFLNRMLSGRDYLSIIHEIHFLNGLDPLNTNSNYLYKFLLDIVTEHPHIFTLTNLLQVSVANWLGVENEKINLLELIRPLAQRPVIVTLHLMRELIGRPSNYGALVFSLLPDDLKTHEVAKIFPFFQRNLSHITMLLWTLWIKSGPLYNIEDGIIRPNYVWSSEITDELHHHAKITTAFSEIIQTVDKGCENKGACLASFRLICDYQKNAEMGFQNLMRDLNDSNKSLSNSILNFSRQILCHHVHCKESYYEEICKALLQNHFNMMPGGDLNARVVASFFAMYFAKYAKESTSSILITAADKLLRLLTEMYAGKFKSTEFVIDCFNFFIALTANRDEEFQKKFYQKIKDCFESLPNELRKVLLLNQTPQMFVEPSEPLYLFQMLSSASNSGDIDNNLSTQISDIFNDDDETSWF